MRQEEAFTVFENLFLLYSYLYFYKFLLYMWNIYTFLSTFKLDIAKLLSYYQSKQHAC